MLSITIEMFMIRQNRHGLLYSMVEKTKKNITIAVHLTAELKYNLKFKLLKKVKSKCTVNFNEYRPRRRRVV